MNYKKVMYEFFLMNEKWITVYLLHITKNQRTATKKAHEKYQNFSVEEI